MSKDNHKIDADDRNVFDVLNERKYTVDYFQREYSWEQKHIEQHCHRPDLETFLDVGMRKAPPTQRPLSTTNNFITGSVRPVSSKGAA
jgi:hypothetical protein